MILLKNILGACKKTILTVLGKKWTANGELVVRRIFLMPTSTGWCFLVATLIIFSFALNFSAIAGYLLGFAVASLLIAAMPLGVHNIARLKLSVLDINPVFLGEETKVAVRVTNPLRKDRISVELSYDKKPYIFPNFNIVRNSSKVVEVPFVSEKRGTIKVPALRISTNFPIGLMHVRSYWAPDAFTVVYCFPEIDGPTFSEIESEVQGNTEWRLLSGHCEFAGIREYVPGDKPRNLAWSVIAKMGGYEAGKFYTKTFDQETGPSRIIKNIHLDSKLDFEKKLSRITSWIVSAEDDGVLYGLNIFGLEIELGNGKDHYHRCLSAVANLIEEPRT